MLFTSKDFNRLLSFNSTLHWTFYLEHKSHDPTWAVVASKDILLRRRNARINFNQNLGWVFKTTLRNITTTTTKTYLLDIPGRMLFAVKMKCRRDKPLSPVKQRAALTKPCGEPTTFFFWVQRLHLHIAPSNVLGCYFCVLVLVNFCISICYIHILFISIF